MAARKHPRSEDALAPDASTKLSDLPVASKRVRKSAPIEKLLDIFELCEQVCGGLRRQLEEIESLLEGRS